MPSKKTARPTSSAIYSPDMSHRLNALLQTMRCIAQHEDKLCTLLHSLKTGAAGDDIRMDLRHILDDMPGDEYEADIASLRATL
jgi:hypothetical protein